MWPLCAVAADVRSVVISEIAWMGTAADVNDEWIELFNNTAADIDLTGWSLTATDGTPRIALSGTIAAGAYFLLERTDDTTVSDVTADQIYTGVLANDGEELVLTDAEENEIDRVDAWHAGDNDTKATMERVQSDVTGAESGNWGDNNRTTVNGTDAVSGALIGTPRAQNSVYAVDTTAPDDVTGLSATTGDTEVSLSWTASASMDVVGYMLFVGSGSGYGAGTDLGNVTSYTVTDLTNGTNYTFKITTYDEIPNDSVGVTASARPTEPDTTAPADTGVLTADAGDMQVALSWSAATDDTAVTDYVLYTDSGSGYDAGTSLGVTTSHTATGLANETSYTFKIVARDAAGNESTGITATATPEGIFATATTGEIIINEIAWAGSSVSTSDEWVELYNTTSKTFDLTGWMLTGAATSGADFALASGTLAPESYFLIGNNSQTTAFTDGESVLAVYPDYVDSSLSLSNATLQISLVDSASTTIDTAGDGSAPLAGSSSEYASMARISSDDGTRASSWHASTYAANLDTDIADLATPGAANFLTHDVAATTLVSSSSAPLPGATVELSATVENVGTTDASDITVMFYDGDPDAGGSTIGTQTVASLASFATTTATQSWTPSAGIYTVYAHTTLADDSYDTNDTVTLDITVSDHVVLSELVPNPSGTDSEEEWIELYNPTSATVDLAGYTIVNGSTELTVDSAELAVGGFAFVHVAGTSGLSWSGSWPTMLNSEDTIELRDASDTLLDSFTYDTFVEGKSHARDPDDVHTWIELWHPTQGMANVQSNTNPTAMITIQGSGDASGSCSFYVNLTGTDSTDDDGDDLTYSWDYGNGTTSDDDNPDGFYYSEGDYTITLTVTDVLGATAVATQAISVSRCSSGSRASSIAQSVPSFTAYDVVISEVLPNPAGSDEVGEWVELWNRDSQTVDISGWSLDDAVGSGSRAYTFSAGTTIPTGGYLLVPRPESGLALNNSGGETVSLLDPAGDVVSTVGYDAAREAQSYARQPDGSWVWAEELTPGVENPVLLISLLPSRAALATDVALHSAMPNPDGSDSGVEWLRLENLTDEVLDLTGFRLATTKKEVTLQDLLLPPGELLQLPTVDLGFSLTNTEGRLSLFAPTGELVSDIVWHAAPDDAIYNPALRPFGETPAQVLRGVDGDTLVVEIDGEIYRVRLLGVNTLEKFDRDPEKRSLAFAATVFTHQQLAGQEVRLVYDHRVFDAYSRLLAYVYLPSGELFNETLICHGYSQPYVRFKFALADDFVQTAARCAAMGKDNPAELPPPLAILDELTPEDLTQLEAALELTVLPAKEEVVIVDSPVVISEILPNPDGADEAGEWVELWNRSDLPVDLLGWSLDDAEGGSRPFYVTEETVLDIDSYLVVPRPQSGLALNNDRDMVRLFGPAGALHDSVTYSSVHAGAVYARAADDTWAETDVHTPGEANIVLRIYDTDLDTDGDGLTDEEEELLGTDPTAYDTDGDGYADGFEVRHAHDPLTPDIDDAVSTHAYQQELTQLTTAKMHTVVGDDIGFLLSGRGVPGSMVRLFIQSHLRIVDVPVDEDGNWQYVLDAALEAGDHNVFVQPVNPAGVTGVAEKVLSFSLAQDFVPATYTTDVIISAVLPNPAGDDAVGEYIELMNTGSEPADISSFHLTVGDRYFHPSDMVLVPGAVVRLDRATTGLTLRNAGDTLSLAWPTGKVIDTLTYGKANDGVIFSPCPSRSSEISQICSTAGILDHAGDDSEFAMSVGDLSDYIVISEVLTNPAGDERTEEFIELANVGDATVRLAGWSFSDASGKTFTFAYHTIAPGERLAVFRPEAKIALNNGSESVVLRDPRGRVMQELVVSDVAEGSSLALDISVIASEVIAERGDLVDSEIATSFAVLSYRNDSLFRTTSIQTPGQANAFDTVYVAGQVRFIGDEVLVLETAGGERSLALAPTGAGLLARAVLRVGDEITGFVAAADERLANFDIVSAVPRTTQVASLPVGRIAVLLLLAASALYFSLPKARKLLAWISR